MPETMAHVTASNIAYLFVCHRKLWLSAHGVEMEHFSETVLEGRLIHASSYQRRSSKFVEIQLDGIKIDFYDPRTRTVHETKRGRSIEEAHIAQVQYYLYKLRQHGILNASGLIEYPDLRKTHRVEPVSDDLAKKIASWETTVWQITSSPDCPAVVNKPYCKQCAFYDLCYINEP